MRNKHLTNEQKNKISKANSGKIRSECCKEKISQTRKELGLSKGKNNPMYGRLTHGKRSYYDSPLQSKVCFRSSYELAYAKYLDSKKILWYYEIETFELSDEMTYTPDFFLPQFEKFVEIKGYMRKESQERIDKFLEEYPWDLEILYGEDLIKLGIKI